MSIIKSIEGLIALQGTQRINTIRDRLLASKVYIWGAGNAGAQTFDLLQQMNVSIVGFIDRRADTIKTYMNKPVFYVDDQGIDIETNENCFIIIGFLCEQQQLNDTQQWLTALGYTNTCHFRDVYALAITDEYMSNYKEQIFQVAAALSDEVSRNVFYSFINAIMNANYELFAQPVDHQYFIDDVPFRKGYSRFIDCGAYNGDTALALKKMKGQVQRLALFEPDHDNFQALCDTLRSARIADEEILFPCGLWSKTQVLRFKSGNQSSSGISEDGYGFIQCVALDDVIRDFSPTFIKMDIEGAEYEALLGAEQLIRKEKPDLAISVYHQIQDMWEIPLLIKRFNPDYQLYLRCHHAYGMETILYATSD